MTVDQLFENYYGSVVAHIRRITGDGEAARDLAQDVFLRAYRITSREPERVLSKAWLYTVARNGAFSFLRRKKIVQFLPINDNDVERFGRPHDESAAVRSDVLAAVATLPEEQRAAVVLTLCYGYSSQEAAAILNASSDAVRQRVCRALKRLRAAL